MKYKLVEVRIKDTWVTFYDVHVESFKDDHSLLDLDLIKVTGTSVRKGQHKQKFVGYKKKKTAWWDPRRWILGKNEVDSDQLNDHLIDEDYVMSVWDVAASEGMFGEESDGIVRYSTIVRKTETVICHSADIRISLEEKTIKQIVKDVFADQLVIHLLEDKG